MLKEITDFRQHGQGETAAGESRSMFGKTNPTLTERDVLEASRGSRTPIWEGPGGSGNDQECPDQRWHRGTHGQPDQTACPLKAQIERDVRTALESRLPGEWKLNITIGIEVRGKGITETEIFPASKT